MSSLGICQPAGDGALNCSGNRHGPSHRSVIPRTRRERRPRRHDSHTACPGTLEGWQGGRDVGNGEQCLRDREKCEAFNLVSFTRPLRQRRQARRQVTHVCPSNNTGAETGKQEKMPPSAEGHGLISIVNQLERTSDGVTAPPQAPKQSGAQND
ncbi:uncharacterized protein LOC118429854 [Branchiostoma floridae]|uniref:Uncharacterized protein LOC118429854 n=1 Tax=Branchiostoma floridae TaxID=7739 RepID=A0A9J7M8V8_BRAFL|nr:uncharacterized protein LOC118429854 [Branchiostoma floridae]